MIYPRTMNRKLDCVCCHEIKNAEDTVKLQKDIDHLGSSSWVRKWGMTFQPFKCNMMQLTNNGIVKFGLLTNLRVQC